MLYAVPTWVYAGGSKWGTFPTPTLHFDKKKKNEPLMLASVWQTFEVQIFYFLKL